MLAICYHTMLAYLKKSHNALPIHRYMMHKKLISIACLMVCALPVFVYAEPLLTLRMQPCSARQQHKNSRKLIEKPVRIGSRTRAKLTTPDWPLNIFATYAGALTTPDWTGKFAFPLHHDSQRTLLVITPMLKPIPLAGNTISHWQLIPGAPAVFYELRPEPSESSEEQTMTTWQAQEIEPPNNGVIPRDAVVIFTKPKYINVPTHGIAPRSLAHLHLPPACTLPGINAPYHSLRVLEIAHLFGPVHTQSKKLPQKHIIHIQ